MPKLQREWLRQLGTRCALLILAVTLGGPGLAGLFVPELAGVALISPADFSQMRAFHALLLALGGLAFWALFQAPLPRWVALLFAWVLALQALTRLLSIYLDGWPGRWGIAYLIVEATLALVFYRSLPREGAGGSRPAP